jgi:hypothetical protein
MAERRKSIDLNMQEYFDRKFNEIHDLLREHGKEYAELSKNLAVHCVTTEGHIEALKNADLVLSKRLSVQEALPDKTKMHRWTALGAWSGMALAIIEGLAMLGTWIHSLKGNH